MTYLRDFHRRAAYTLVELIVASAASTVLFAGMASSVYIASQALDIDEGASAVRSKNMRALGQIVRDVHHALGFTERTATAMTLTVPDRDGDGLPETIRYAWSGTPGDPLTYEINGASGRALVTDVNGIHFDYTTRTLLAPAITAPPVAATVEFQEFTEAKLGAAGTSLIVGTPPSAVEGDLLIAAVATDGDTQSTLAAPAGWNLLRLEKQDTAVTFGVWWKLTTASEPSTHQFTWTNGEHAYGWIMRFTGHDAAEPIEDHSVQTTAGSVTTSPTSPAVATTVDHVLVLRLAGFDDDDITSGDPGLPGHTAITMDSSTTGIGTVSGAAGWAAQETAGTSGTSTFSLTAQEQAVAVTIAIAPEDDL